MFMVSFIVVVGHDARVGVVDVVDLVDAIHVHPELVVSPFGGVELALHGCVEHEVGGGEDEEQDDDDRHWLAPHAFANLTGGEDCRVNDK